MDIGKDNMFEKVLDIGIKVYSMQVEELQSRRAELKRIIAELKSRGETDMDLQTELLVVNTRMADEGILDIEKLDIEEKGLMEMYNGF